VSLPETVQAQHDMVRTGFDVVIIGAGINGAGIARDAAMRGLKVLLIDKSDLASGTTSASTRLIHGGLRYLEHLEFRLVRESLQEREILMRIAPHLVRRLPITIPIYTHSKRGPLTIRAGMIAYDLLSWTKSMPRHQMLSRDETLRQLPGLNRRDLLGAARYFDAQVEFAERLVVENLLAAQMCGAEVLTYTPVTKLVTRGSKIFAVEFGDRSSASAGVVINAAGPWIDYLLKDAAVESPRLIGGTKGSHIVAPPFPGAPASAIYLEASSDRRPIFIIPWDGNYLIGATDVRFEENPDQVSTELWEIDYLLAETNLVFPEAQLRRDHILFSYSGVRPLPASGEKEEQSITRRHFIREHPRFGNLLSIVGGKLTTYRSLAEECVDLIFEKLGRTSPRCETATTPLPGAVNFESFAAEFMKSDVFTPEVRERLLRVYGSRAGEVAQLHKDPFTAQIIFAFKHESAKNLADCLRRAMILSHR
jgi:glycerol-3-phosphate dehydrogenase